MKKTTNTLLIKHLMEFGLGEKESGAYLALLELEVATVSEVARTANINRSSMYVVLSSLKKKGLVSVSGDKKVQRFMAIMPEVLLQEAKEKAKNAEEVKSKISDIIPELKALYKDTKHKPTVRVYEGVTGLREVYYNLFSTEAKDIKVYANPGEILKVFPDFSESHNIPRIKRGIKMQAINPATKETFLLLKNYPKNTKDEIILIPKNNFRFSSDLAIFGNRIALASPKEKFGIIIENEEIANLLRASFQLAWEEAKRLNAALKK